MKLIVQPDDGVAPLLKAIKKATKRIDLVIFRFDVSEIEKALEAAVARGVAVRALVATRTSAAKRNSASSKTVCWRVA